MATEPDTKATDAAPGKDAPADAPGDATVAETADGAVDGRGSMLGRIAEFPHWRDELVAVPIRSSRSLTLDPDIDVEPILPDGWRDEPKRRRRKARRRRRRERKSRPWLRRARWSLLGLLLLGGVAAAGLLIWVPQYAESLADGVVTDYREGLDELQARIAPMEAALPTLASVDLTGPELENIQPAFARLRTSALALSETTREPLPETPPLLPREVIDELAPVRARVSLVAGRADAVTGRIGRLVNYRNLLDDAFVLPEELPTVAEPLEVNDLSLTLAAMLADSLDVVSKLPTDPFLDAHRAEVAETLDWFRTWEVDYLQALRRDGGGAASTLVNQARSRLGRLRIGLGAPLEEFRQWAEEELAGLDTDIATTRILVARAEPDAGG